MSAATGSSEVSDTGTKRSCLICGGSEHAAAFEEFGVSILRCLTCGHLSSSFDGDEHYDGYFGYEDDPASPERTGNGEEARERDADGGGAPECTGDGTTLGADEGTSADAGLPGAEDGHFWWNEAHRKMYSAFARRYLGASGGRLLDVGCGLGYFVKHCTDNTSWEAWGVEISSKAVRFATGKLGLERVRSGLLGEAGFEPCSFDVVTLWDVIEHIKNPTPFLQDVLEVLKPGGMLFVHTPNAPFQLFKARLKKALFGLKREGHYLEARDHLHIYSRHGLAVLLERCGFTGVDFTHLPPIQSVSGSRSSLLTSLKNGWYHCSRLVFALSGGRYYLNNNLFAVARKPRGR